MCCERDLDAARLSSSRLAAPNGLLHRLCKQCDDFLSLGLSSLLERIESRKLKRVSQGEMQKIELRASRVSDDIAYAAAAPMPGDSYRSRRASAIEKELFSYHSLSVELHIEGFIKGLEAAGLERSSLSREAEIAVNNLLEIAQTLAGDRLRIRKDTLSRADVRRLERHLDDVSLMVNEYVRAVAEECVEPKRRSGHPYSHGRDSAERRISASPK
jgi:hypothetical protein